MFFMISYLWLVLCILKSTFLLSGHHIHVRSSSTNYNTLVVHIFIFYNFSAFVGMEHC